MKPVVLLFLLHCYKDMTVNKRAVKYFRFPHEERWCLLVCYCFWQWWHVSSGATSGNDQYVCFFSTGTAVIVLFMSFHYIKWYVVARSQMIIDRTFQVVLAAMGAWKRFSPIFWISISMRLWLSHAEVVERFYLVEDDVKFTEAYFSQVELSSLAECGSVCLQDIRCGRVNFMQCKSTCDLLSEEDGSTITALGFSTFKQHSGKAICKIMPWYTDFLWESETKRKNPKLNTKRSATSIVISLANPSQIQYQLGTIVFMFILSNVVFLGEAAVQTPAEALTKSLRSLGRRK